ncbi:MAG: MFS transporter [Alphaproteobacteria bacterium]|nr:MFS transporter [Alphaproteobacteria bacterium]MBV9693212.1 MFS transporter [Alphaproteobacteria bacterium]
MKSSTDAAEAAVAAADEPAETAIAEAAGWAQWLGAREGFSTTGDRSASRLGQTSWALFEWARNPFVLLITIYLFAPYFSNDVVGDPVRGLADAGWVQGISGIVIALLAPFLGAIADHGGRRKPWIAFYTLILATAMVLLWFAKPHSTGFSLFLVGATWALANVSFDFSAVFHNSLLPSIVSPKRIAGLSGLGLALGNAAGILLLLFMLLAFSLPGKVAWSFVPSHPIWGISQALHEPERLAGPVGAIWLVIFSIPLFLFTPDRPASSLSLFAAMRAGVKSVIRTVISLRHYKNVGFYLLARLFFNDGMTAVLVFGGIYASSTFHWGPVSRIIYGIVLSVFAVLGGFVGGWLDNALGSKRAIFVSIGGTTLFGLLALTMGPDRILWFIPYDPHGPTLWKVPFFNTWPELIYLGIVCFIAILITAGYANSRTMLARIAPIERMTEFFGLYALSGQATSFLATIFIAWLAVAAHSQRIGLLGETMFLSIGLALMFFVREERATAL